MIGVNAFDTATCSIPLIYHLFMNHLLFVNSFTDSCVCQFHPLSTALSQINAGRMYLHLKCIYLIIYFYEFTIILNTSLSMRRFLNKE